MKQFLILMMLIFVGVAVFYFIDLNTYPNTLVLNPTFTKNKIDGIYNKVRLINEANEKELKVNKISVVKTVLASQHILIEEHYRVSESRALNLVLDFLDADSTVIKKFHDWLDQKQNNPAISSDSIQHIFSFAGLEIVLHASSMGERYSLLLKVSANDMM